MSNRIVAENQLNGSPPSDWDIQETQNWTIEGFATEISLNAGATVDFKINTSSTNYRIDIYRLGYYGGMGARRVDSVPVQLAQPQVQPNRQRDDDTGLIDAGNWAISASWPIPANAVSGVYIAKLIRQDSTFGQNHIPFIVRDDAGHSDVVFQTSDTTWQAYNSWGGISLYGGDGPGTDSATVGRAYKVSYNRPFITRWGGFYAGPQDWIFGVEHAAIRWLEKNGYDVSYISGLDSSRSGARLLDHKVFFSVGHDEYWSGAQRSNVEAARDQGVHLAFLSGNEVYWRTRWEPSMAGPATANRTLVCYKETRAHDDIDPSTQWTGTFRDPRFAGPNALGAGMPENALTGTLFTVDSYRLDTIEIPYAHSRMRFWRNTGVDDTDPGDVAALTTGYLGYEWDSDLDNGQRPAGLINLSQSIVSVHSLLLDYGTVTGPGTAEHNLTLYRAPSGALVFGAGTVYWAWGLDDSHDLEQVPADIRVKQAMVNLLADMGVQPVTLETGLFAATQSTDLSPPVSSIAMPLGSIAHNQTVTINGTAADTGGGVVGGVEISTDNGVTWHKANGRESWSFAWTPSLGGSYTLRSRATDDSGNIETPGAGISVTVTGPTGKTLFSPYARPQVLNSDDANAYELGMKFVPAANGTVSGVRFYKGPNNVGTHTGTLWSAGGTQMATTTFANETAQGWQTATFANAVPVTGGSTYVVSYHTNGLYSVNDFFFTSAVTNNGLTAPASASSSGNGLFASGAATSFPTNTFEASNYWVDVLYHPASTSPQPPDAVADTGFTTPQNTALQLTASQLLVNDTDPNGDPLTITSVLSPINGTVALNAGVITFTPSNNFTGSAGFSYVVSDGQGGTDAATVTIAVLAPATGETLFASAATPATVTVNDTVPVELGMKFTPASSGIIKAIRFYKGPQNAGPHSGTLWSLGGTAMASLTFTNETGSGWQTGQFITPPAVVGGTTYVVSYHSNGFYSADANYFTSAVSNGSLTAPASGSSGGNGVFTYSPGSSFPNQSFNASNYWVDVVFESSGPNQPPFAVDDFGFSTPLNTPLQIPSATLLANDSDPNGGTLSVTGVSAPSNGTVSRNAGTGVITFTPANNYAGHASFSYAISDGQGGSDTGAVSLFVQPTGAGLFPPTAMPGTITVNDSASVELGMKFVPAVSGVIKGIRFYKGPQNVGTHSGTLWTGAGVLMASLVFNNETSFGWQTALFATPIAVTGGLTYVVSYHCSGFYSATSGGLAGTITNGNLTAPSSTSSGGNGVFTYGASTSFPVSSFNATNYWVDVIFE